MNVSKTIRVRVSAESDGYREATRASTVEVDAREREVVDTSATERDVKRRARRVRWIIAGVGMTPLFVTTVVLSFMSSGHEHGDAVVAFFGAATIVTGLAFLSSGWLKREQTIVRLRTTQPETEAQSHIVTRPRQTLTLVGRTHHDDAGNDRPLSRVRVQVDRDGADRRTAILAEYEDGSMAPLLEDLADDEVAELRACVAAHDIPVFESSP